MARRKGDPLVTWDDKKGDKSLYALMRGDEHLIHYIDALQPEILSLNEKQLERQIRNKDEQRAFPRELGYLKIRFWQEYRAAQDERRGFRSENVYLGLVNKDYWSLAVLQDPINLAWLIQPPVDELVVQKEILNLSMHKIRDVLDHDIVIEKTKTTTLQGNVIETVKWTEVNIPLVKEIHSILKTMQDRVHGSVLQRQQIEQTTTSRNLNINASAPAPGQVYAPNQMSLDRPDLTVDDILEFKKHLEATAKLLNQMSGGKAALPDPADKEKPKKREPTEDDEIDELLILDAK